MRLPLLVSLMASAAAAQLPTIPPGSMDAGRVKAGTYALDPAHTQVVFTVNHLGFNSYWGIFGDATGTLALDPAKPSQATLAVTVPLSGLTTTSAALTKHLKAADFFDAARFPTATFRSTKIEVIGTNAIIAGNLTLHGVTKPIVLSAKFTGAGRLAMPGMKDTVGFEGETKVKRSDFGIDYGVGMVSDVVPLKITAAFEKR